MPQIFCAGFQDYGLHKGGTIMITLSGNRGFESDNCAPVHPRVMAALERKDCGQAALVDAVRARIGGGKDGDREAV